MLFLVVMSILLALSDLFGPDAKIMKLDHTLETKVPVYVAVLYAFIFPLSASAMNMTVKYANVNLKIEANDWVLSNSFLYGVIGTIVGIIYFCE